MKSARVGERVGRRFSNETADSTLRGHRPQRAARYAPFHLSFQESWQPVCAVYTDSANMPNSALMTKRKLPVGPPWCRARLTSTIFGSGESG